MSMSFSKKLPLFVALSLSLASCTSVISEGVESDGTVSGKVIFPAMEKATLKQGLFPNIDNLDLIAPGMSRDDLFYLLGHPHFHEMKGAREWDYILKFRKADQSVKTCQYKVIFDQSHVAQSFYWQPENCAHGKPHESVTLSADTLFAFDKAGITDTNATAKASLDAFAAQLARRDNRRITVTGYTDYLGDAAYNRQLSLRRAQAVARYLEGRGVKAKRVVVKGFGESNPVVSCERETNRAALIACLAPNRRVDIRAW